MSKLQTLTEQFTAQGQSIKQMEKGYLRQAIVLCLALLKFVIELKVRQNTGQSPINQTGECLKNAGKRTRKYLSLFGLITFTRPSFHSDQRGMLYLVDESLDMPKELWSYNLQELTSCLLYTSPSPRDRQKSRMPSSA